MSLVQPLHALPPTNQRRAFNLLVNIHHFLKGIDDGRKSECKFHLSRYLSLDIPLTFNKYR